MLRDYVYTLDPSLLEHTLSRFDVLIPAEQHKHALIQFQVLTPDSFIWKFLIDGVVYYLYAEDYIQGLKFVHDEINHYAVENSQIEFVKAKHQKQFDDTDPARNTAVYKEPEDYDEMKLYAVDSGYDFVFLCTSNEDASKVFFNN